MEKLLSNAKQERKGILHTIIWISILLIMLIVLQACPFKTQKAELTLFSVTGKSLYPDVEQIAPNFSEPWIRYRKVELNKRILEHGNISVGDRITLNLFEDKHYSALIDRVDSHVEGTISIRAKIDGTASGVLIISTEGNAVLGMVILPETDEHFVISTVDDTGIAYLREVNTSEMAIPEDGSPAIPPDALDISKAIIEKELEGLSTANIELFNFWAAEGFYTLIATADRVSQSLISMLHSHAINM
jgi:hypothetical protein